MTFTSLFLHLGLLSLTHKYKHDLFLALLTCMWDRWLASPQLCWLRRSSPGATWPRGPLAKATVCDTPIYAKLNLAIGELRLGWAGPGLARSALLSSPLLSPMNGGCYVLSVKPNNTTEGLTQEWEGRNVMGVRASEGEREREEPFYAWMPATCLMVMDRKSAFSLSFL